MCQGTLGPNGPNKPIARGYAWYTPNTFKKEDIVFLNNKNIKIKRPYKKLNNKKFNPFKIITKIDYFYRLELSITIRIFNIFHFKLLTLIVTNPLSS